MADVGEKSPTDLLPADVGPELHAMLAAHPLPRGVPDADMNQNEIAAALSVTVNTLGKWLSDETFPVVQRGTMGKAYILRLSHCWAWKAARDAKEDSRRRHNQSTIEKLQATFLGLDLDDDEPRLSFKDREALAVAELRWMDAQRKRRQLLPLEDVVELFDAVFGIVRNGIEGMPDRLERELSLASAQVALVERIASDILDAMVAEIEQAELQGRDLADIQPQHQLLV